MDRHDVAILSPLQHRVLDAVFAEEAFARVFYLTGGTALAAFHLFHRYSDDLDFFTNADQIDFLWPMLQSLQGSLGWIVESRSPRYVRLRVAESLRVDFVQDAPFRIGTPVRHGSWQIDTIENILVNKITAIQGRLDAKDYVDVYVAWKARPIEELLTWLTVARQKDASIDPFVWSRIIGDVETLRVWPRMITSVSREELITFYRTVRRHILASLKPPDRADRQGSPRG